MLEGLDYLVLAAYLLVVACIGLLASRGQHSGEDYFLGSRRIPFWAAGLSIIATETSALTFLGAPTQSLFGTWTYIQLAIGSVLARFVVAGVLIPAYYKARVYTVYEYLEQRFGPVSKNLATVLFMVGRSLGSGVRLYGAAIAFTILVPSADYSLVIVAIAAVAVAYTLAGGIRSVIWTDVLQGLLLFVGGAVALWFLWEKAPDNAYEILRADGKLQWLDWGFRRDGDETWFAWNDSFTLIGGVIGVLFLTMATHGTDQDMIQRSLTCRDQRGGQGSLWVSAALNVPIVFLFLAIGSLLYANFGSAEAVAAQQQLLEAQHDLPAGKGKDYIFPFWILSNLPAGFKGLILAGLFAAAMSSLDSAVAALSSTAVNNVYRPYFAKHRSEAHYMGAGRVFSIVFGALLIGVAMLVFSLEGRGTAGSGFGVLKLGLEVLTWIFPPLLGVFLVGVLTKRGSDLGNALALLVAIGVLLGVKFWPELASALWSIEGATVPWGWVWNPPIGCAISFGIATLFVARRHEERRA
ncbi:MAG: hypothetical protein H6832_08030 [Planctomycetes bacterium]|nr:hypothetical protein [Planctomycetota bacterium]MCB9918336.1 hypothetical protein [Planctomycetota bacterium]